MSKVKWFVFCGIHLPSVCQWDVGAAYDLNLITIPPGSSTISESCPNLTYLIRSCVQHQLGWLKWLWMSHIREERGGVVGAETLMLADATIVQSFENRGQILFFWAFVCEIGWIWRCGFAVQKVKTYAIRAGRDLKEIWCYTY